VRSVSPSDVGYLVDVPDGEPGQLVTRGDNLMSGYVGNDAATAKALVEGGWYTNLGDVVFRLRSATDGE
jgi:long-chain acyl-CoA synthetase